MSEPIITVLIAAGVSVAVAWLTSSISTNSAREKLQREFALEYAAESAVRSLLSHKGWELRTFEEIKKRLGGFDDGELQRLLVRSGAVRAIRKDDGAELWGLVNRNPDLLEKCDD